jgi:hypothetical protein
MTFARTVKEFKYGLILYARSARDHEDSFVFWPAKRLISEWWGS